jgi:hypothetical protein
MTEKSQVEISPGTAPPSNSAVDFSVSQESPRSEDLALAELKNRDLSADAVELISQNAALMKSRKIRIALASHPGTPRRIALRLIRELYTFELVKFALSPTPPADLKRIADEYLIARIASMSLGERISLARRSSQMVAAALLLDKEKRVWQGALQNSRMTESAVVKAVQKSGAAPEFVQAVCGHAKWSVRAEIRRALLRNADTPLAKALEFARPLPGSELRDLLHASRLPERIKTYLLKDLESRS